MIFLTARGSVSDRVNGLRAGADPARPGKILPETPAAARRRQAREQQALLKRIDEYDGGVRR